MISTRALDTSVTGTRGRVSNAIQLAASRTGVDFGYLFNQARVESSLDPNARARTSSATGLFQFIDQTWLATVKRHGAAHGLGWAAGAIQRGGNGRFHIADPATRHAVMELRKNPEAASAMAAEFAADNQEYLEGRLGRSAEPVDLYLAHFLGPAGAARFLSAHDASPDAPAAALLPQAARANRTIFYDRSGSARSFAEIRERFAAKIGGPSTSPSQRIGPPPLILDMPTVRLATMRAEESGRGSAPAAGPAPQYARLAYLMLAQLGG